MHTSNLFLLLLVIVSWSYDVKGGLYTENDGVEILTSENINSTIFQSEYGWMVEFYSASCGYCRRYAPVMKQLADDIDTWKDLVKLGTVNCDAYPETCKQFQIKQYPTFRYFYPNQLNGTGRHLEEIESSDTVESTRTKLVNVLISEQREKRGDIYPLLLPYRGDDVSDLINFSGKQYVLLIVQVPESTLGAELAMYFHTVPEILITYSHHNNTPLLERLGSNSNPSLYVISEDGKHETLTVYGTNTKAFKAAIERFLKSEGLKVPIGTKHGNSVQTVEDNKLITIVKSMGDQVYLGDLESAIRFSLRTEVFLKDILKQPERQALKLFIQLVRLYVPMSLKGRELMGDIRRYLNYNKIATGAAIRQLLDAASREDENVFYTDQKWIGCVGQSEAYRGYPCSLWKLFHYLTVNAASDSSLPVARENVALQGMYGYIRYFFGCGSCRDHFLEMAKRRRINQVASRRDAVLWLWEAHNEVNNRLHGDVTEDPNFPKVQFPLAENCPTCRDYTGEYNESEVYKYLFNMYAKKNVNYYGSKIQV